MSNIQLINMVGGGFQHDFSSSANKKPKLIEWVKNNHTAPISIHIDNSIMSPVDKTKKNYAWLSESKTIIPNVYNWAKDNITYMEENFELIFTHDKSLLNLSDKMKLVICNAIPWVNNHGIHKKTKLVSMIASNKKMCSDHIKRLEIAEKYKHKLDLFGRGHNYIEYKEDGLNDYCFSITMENGLYPNMFTEKISDCFATGTIPIYWGCNEISEMFNPNGIIMLDDNFNIDDLSFDLYYSKMDAIKDNYNIIMNLPIAEDYIYENYIK
jgi:hypothetical protein